jgi:hypothetical protein
MGKNTTNDDNDKTVETVQKLLALAQDESNEQEARSAAVKAVRLMKESNLQVVASSELERMQKVVGEARDMVIESKKESRKNMVLGGLLGYAIANAKF